MKNTGKTSKTEQENTNIISNSNYFPSSSDPPCIKHPSNTSSIGICAYCLNEKLLKLICLECGEQRLCSCSCSDLDSYRNSSCNVDIGSVGRMSFLIENEKNINNNEQKTLFTHLNLKMKQSETEDIVLLKRSNSCVVEVSKGKGFWRFNKFFKKKRENECGFDQRSEDCAMDVTKSRSVSNACSSAKMSDFSEFELRKNGFKGGLMDLKRGFVVKESEFSRIDDNDDDEFIDLKIDLSNRVKTEDSVLKCDLAEGGGLGSTSSRIMVNERGIKKVKNGHVKAWKWMFKHHYGKSDFDHVLES